jgi:L-lactate utilization protein LutC
VWYGARAFEMSGDEAEESSMATQVRVKSFKRTEYIEIGKDMFDQAVSEALSQIGAENIISVLPLNYEHIDIATEKIVTDYGIIVVYKVSK